MGIAPEEEVDLVGNERQRRMKTPQLLVLQVAGDTPRQNCYPEAGEGEALDQLEISARE